MARPVRRNTSSRPWHRGAIALSTMLCAAAITLGLATPAFAAPAVVSFSAALHASQDKFTPRGGYSTLTATVSGATSCTLSLSPAIAGVPMTVACSGTGAVSVRVDFPVNAVPMPVSYNATLSATDGTTTVKTSATIVVEGFRWLGVARDHVVPATVTAESCANPDDFPTPSSFHPPCVEISRDGEAAFINRSIAHWSDVDGTVPLVAVSCAPGSNDFCGVLDAKGDYVVFNGQTWSSPAPLALSGGVPLRLESIVCGTLPATGAFASRCIAADASGHVAEITFGATNAVAVSTIPLRGPTYVACATPELCMAVDRAGEAVFMSASGFWTKAPVRVDVVPTVSDATCTPDQHTCVVTDSNGGVVDFELAGLHPVHIERLTSVSLVGRRTAAIAAACGMSYCLAVYANGALAQGVRGVWSETKSMSLHPGDHPIGLASATQATSVWCSVVTHGWRAGAAVVSRTDAGFVIPVI